MKKNLLKSCGFLLSFVCVCLLGTFVSEAFQYQLGDINRVGGVDAADALLALQYSAGIAELDEYQQTVADVNKDGVIASGDALQILKVAAKLDVFQIRQNMTIAVEQGYPAPEFTIDKIFDVSYFAWTCEVSGGEGITVERTVKELPDDVAPGDTPEQVYKVIVNEYGTYTITLRLVDVTDDKDVAEERVYTIQTYAAGLLWDDPETINEHLIIEPLL